MHRGLHPHLGDLQLLRSVAVLLALIGGLFWLSAAHIAAPPRRERCVMCARVY